MQNARHRINPPTLPFSNQCKCTFLSFAGDGRGHGITTFHCSNNKITTRELVKVRLLRTNRLSPNICMKIWINPHVQSVCICNSTWSSFSLVLLDVVGWTGRANRRYKKNNNNNHHSTNRSPPPCQPAMGTSLELEMFGWSPRCLLFLILLLVLAMRTRFHDQNVQQYGLFHHCHGGRWCCCRPACLCLLCSALSRPSNFSNQRSVNKFRSDKLIQINSIRKYKQFPMTSDDVLYGQYGEK